MVYIEAENRKTGKPKFFTETAWRNLQNSKIENPFVRASVPSRAASKNLIPGKTVQVPKEVLDFKNKQVADENSGDTGSDGSANDEKQSESPAGAAKKKGGK